ncbi:MAG: hypothetical protein H0W76_07660 [Pyrinomonadaceae bacterium]|nr:hypothetical protein [Pyrinomonadaceae bacterium]
MSEWIKTGEQIVRKHTRRIFLATSAGGAAVAGGMALRKRGASEGGESVRFWPAVKFSDGAKRMEPT